MQLHTNTPDRLVLSERPWLFFLFFGVIALLCAVRAVGALGSDAPGAALPMLIAMGSALVMLWYFVRPVRLVVDVAQDRVEVRQISLTGVKQVDVPLSQVAKAGVQGPDRPGGGPQPLWLALEVDGRWRAMTPPSRLGGEARAAQMFNAWLKAHRARESLRG